LNPNIGWGNRLDSLEFAVREGERIEREVLEKYAGENIPDDYKKQCEDLVTSAKLHLPSFDEIMAAAIPYVSNPLVDPTLFVSPKLWTPFSQEHQKLYLANSAIEIIQALQSERRTLDDIHWKDLEELVAELLRQKGMEIHLVNESPQGGRDIIARAAYIPGYGPLTIAVEVKHMRTVDRPIVQQALYQNRHFPALLIATSGQFTLGAVEEAKKPENRMRLFLHDGVAVRDMIRNYVL